MNKENREKTAIPQHTAAKAQDRGDQEGIGHSDHFLRLMFFQASNVSEAYAGPRISGHAVMGQQAQSSSRHAAHYVLPDRNAVQPVSAESPALEVMTDLRHVAAITTTLLATIDEANRTMIANAVRALFVIDDKQRLLGLVTATDVLGEKPIKITQQRGIRHDEILVRDIMTPADVLEVINVDDVLHAQVGDVVALLRRAGRQHALVVDPPGRQAHEEMQMIRGIFSLAQIARQLGVELHSPETARSFAEIEAAIGI